MKQLAYFSAPWCQPCRAFGPIVEKFSEDNGLMLVKVNIDENPELGLEHNITSIPVLMLFDGQELVHRIDGAKPRPVLDKQLLELL